MYSASFCSGIAARHDECPLEFGSHSIERANRRFGFTGVSLFVLSVSSPSPHVAPYHSVGPLSGGHDLDPRPVTRPITQKRIDRPRHAVRKGDCDNPCFFGRQLARQPVRFRTSEPSANHDHSPMSLGPVAFHWLIMAPRYSRRRIYRLPIFEMPPLLGLPPVECCFGVSPSQAA